VIERIRRHKCNFLPRPSDRCVVCRVHPDEPEIDTEIVLQKRDDVDAGRRWKGGRRSVTTIEGSAARSA
jgi:hypothetical protein